MGTPAILFVGPSSATVLLNAAMLLGQRCIEFQRRSYCSHSRIALLVCFYYEVKVGQQAHAILTIDAMEGTVLSLCVSVLTTCLEW
jgi:hypothetical protein